MQENIDWFEREIEKSRLEKNKINHKYITN
jgi:dimeric dUTPase (all-alpha-NTP-PPase superfamily)